MSRTSSCKSTQSEMSLNDDDEKQITIRNLRKRIKRSYKELVLKNSRVIELDFIIDEYSRTLSKTIQQLDLLLNSKNM